MLSTVRLRLAGKSQGRARAVKTRGILEKPVERFGLPAAPAPRRKRASAADTAAIKASFRSIEFPQKGEIVE